MNLPSYLKSLGYVEISFVKARTNQIKVEAKVNGADVTLVVDTGASHTCIADSSVERLRLTRGRIEPAGSLAALKKNAALSNLDSLEIGLLRMTNVKAWIVDFSYINMMLQTKGESLCDGVLGADILLSKSAVVDYKGFKLYLKGE